MLNTFNIQGTERIVKMWILSGGDYVGISRLECVKVEDTVGRKRNFILKY